MGGNNNAKPRLSWCVLCSVLCLMSCVCLCFMAFVFLILIFILERTLSFFCTKNVVYSTQK